MLFLVEYVVLDRATTESMEHDIHTKLCDDYLSRRDEAAQCWLEHAEYAERSQIVSSLYPWGATQQCERI